MCATLCQARSRFDFGRYLALGNALLKASQPSFCHKLSCLSALKTKMPSQTGSTFRPNNHLDARSIKDTLILCLPSRR